MKAIIQNKIMEISQTAAAFLDGDDIKSLTIEDRNNSTEKYRESYNILATFMTNSVDNNAGLAFIYCLVKNDEEKIVFSVDPSDDPAIFLEEEPINTDALLKAFDGTAAFDKDSYVDRWGDLYSAYAPVFGLDGTVKAVVGVDVWASWYKNEIGFNAVAIGIITLVTVALGTFVAVFITRKMHNKLSALSDEMDELQGNIHKLLNDIRDPKYLSTNMKDDARTEESNGLVQLKEQIYNTKVAIKDYIEYAHHQAYLDTLTGLGNRNAYYLVVENIEKKIDNDEYLNFAVIVFDINGMKKINDIYGHEAGDIAIKTCGECLKETFGETNSFRIGGDEMVVIYQNVYEKTIQNKITNFNQMLSKRNSDLEFDLSMSSGFSFFDKGKDKKLQDVFNRADENMYVEKDEYYLSKDIEKRE